MRTLLIVITGSLVAMALTGCPKKQPQHKPNPVSLTVIEVRALLHGCEAHARKGDDVAFRSCLTRESIDELDRTFARTRQQVVMALNATRPLHTRTAKLSAEDRRSAPVTAFENQRQQLDRLWHQLGWKSHLQLIARAPAATVEQLEVTGNRATFVKLLGRRRTTHYLSRVDGSWKVDLAANPDLKRRIGALRLRAASAIQQLQAAAAALERHPTGRVSPKRD